MLKIAIVAVLMGTVPIIAKADYGQCNPTPIMTAVGVTENFESVLLPNGNCAFVVVLKSTTIELNEPPIEDPQKRSAPIPRDTK